MKRLFDIPLRHSVGVWVESIGITLTILAIGFIATPNDPFFLHSEFQWLWCGPLLVALRYGMAPSMVSLGILVVAWSIFSWQGLLQEAFPTQQILGGLLITLVSAQFSTIWNQRMRRTHQVSRHALERFEQLSKAYYMIRQSHDRLEQNLISRPVTLRQAMHDLRGLLVKSLSGFNRDSASEMLGILSNYCSIESAAIYLSDDEDSLEGDPVASCGRGAPLIEEDLLLRSAIESGNTAYQVANRLRLEERSTYLVAAPIVSSSGKRIGMLLVTEMPFLSLQRETLQIMAVLLSYAADHVEASVNSKGVLAVYPDCPTIFAAELFKMVRLRKELDISSSIVAISIRPSPRLEDICAVLERQQRGLDHAWRRSVGWGVQFVTLMPFSGPGSVEGYLTRLNGILTKQHRMTVKSAGISFNSLVLTSEDPLLQLAELLSEDM